MLKIPRVLGAQVEGCDEDLLVCSCFIGTWGSKPQMPDKDSKVSGVWCVPMIG